MSSRLCVPADPLRGLLLSVSVVAADQLIKQWVINDVRTRTTLLDVVSIVHTENPAFLHGAFAVAAGWAVAVAAVLLATLIGVAILRRAHPLLWVPAGLATGGLVSNAVERLRLGYVTDYLHLGFLGQTNLADIALVLGTAGVIAFTAVTPAIPRQD